MKSKIINSKAGINDGNGIDLYIIDADEKTTRSIFDSLKQKNFSGKIAVIGRDNKFNRRAVETLKIDYLISPEREVNERKDTLKQRDSGLNHFLAKECAKKGIKIIIDFDDIQKMQDRKEKAKRIARIIQNIKICRRAKCRIIIWKDGKADKYSIQAFGFSLGMSSQQVKDAVRFE